MMRISTFGSSQLYLARLMEIRNRLFDEQLQVTTKMKAQTYDGIAGVSRRAINMENETSLFKSFIASNAVVEVRQNAAAKALEAAKTSMTQLKNRLITFASGQQKDENSVREVQEVAMRTLSELQSALNTSVDGSFLFAGGRRDTQPVVFETSSLSDFQSLYDGNLTKFPTVRDANLLDTRLTRRDLGSLTFDPSSGSMFPATAGAFRDVASTTRVTVSGTANNDGKFTVNGHTVTNATGVPMAETSSIGSGAFVTYSGGSLTNAATGNLAIAFDKSGRMTATPATSNTLSQLIPGTKFSVAGSDAKFQSITAADATTLVGTNLATYTGGASSATPLTIKVGDKLNLDDGVHRETLTVTATTTVADVVTWVNSLDATFGTDFARANVDNQGRLEVFNTQGAAGKTITVSGTLQALLGLGGTLPVGAGAAGDTDPAAVVRSSAIHDNVTAQKLTSLTDSTGAALAAVGDTLTVNGALPASTVSATSTLADLTTYIQSKVPSSYSVAGGVTTNNPGATVTFAAGKLTITNNSGAPITLGGTNLAANLGLPVGPATIANAASASSSVLPSVVGTYDGNYIVTGYDSTTGAVTFEVDNDQSREENVAVSAITMTKDNNADGIPELAVGSGLSSGSAVFSISGNKITMTLPTGGTNLTTAYAAGDPITIAGTENHNGTFNVTAVTANSISWEVGPDPLRMSVFVPQSNRTDVTMTFTTTEPATANNPLPTVPGTVYGGTATMNKDAFGGLTFSSAGTITTSIPGKFLTTGNTPYPPVGTAITLKSPLGTNDGVYEVTSNDGTTITVRNQALTSESAVTTGEVAATSWYKGDTLPLKTHIDRTTTIEASLQASDPAFEKAVRACGLVAQGVFGTAGGLDNHPERAEAAIQLLIDAMEHHTRDAMPFGDELPSDILGLVKRIGLNLGSIKRSNDTLAAMNELLQTRVADLEQVDTAEAIVRLQNDNQALEASYRALAQSQQLSLLAFLK